MYNKKQRFAALLGVIMLVLLYLITLVCAIFNFDGAGILFQSCLFATIAFPILIWIYVWLFGKLTGKKTIADLQISDTEDTGSKAESGTSTAPATVTTISKRKKNK